jgi:ribosomal protein S18 acetylase RimI-like enzyme
VPDRPPPVHVRPAAPADVAAVLALWERARSGHATTPDTPEALGRLIEAAPDALLVAVADRTGEIVGALVAAWDGWRGNMYRLAVRPPERRRGIALALVREGESRLRAKGARRVTALVANDDAPAMALWDAAGYARDTAIGRFVRAL